jgi:hypothetical protein
MVSPESARADYGVVVDATDFSIDMSATETLRAAAAE